MRGDWTRWPCVRSPRVPYGLVARVTGPSPEASLHRHFVNGPAHLARRERPARPPDTRRSSVARICKENGLLLPESVTRIGLAAVVSFPSWEIVQKQNFAGGSGAAHA